MEIRRSGTRRIISDASGSNGGWVFTGSGGNKFAVGAIGNDFSISDSSYMGDPGGSERLRILQSGNVGIGETSPDNILHITKDQGGAASALKLENKAGANNTGFDIDFQLASSGLSAKIGAVRTNSPGAGDSDIFFSTSTNGTSVTEAMRITHDSKVGIGTSSPYTKLNVVETGSGVINYPLQLSNVTTTNNSGVGIIFNVSSNSAYPNARIAVERTDSDARS